MSPNVTLKPREFVIALSCAALGGFVGTLLRDVLTGLERLPPATAPHVSWFQEIPWILLVINFAGVFAATRLLRGSLRGHDPNNFARILVITGFFGGLTSYSGLFVAVAAMWHLCIAGAISAAVGAVLSGILAAGLGLVGHRR